jgi:REP element-mobilizing transposase RayT
MPNHVHGIFLFVGDIPGYDPVGATPASRRGAAASSSPLPTGPRPGSLGAVVGSYKAAVSRKINQLRAGSGTGLWQPNYYDHIIRSDYSNERIDDYIVTNPLRWGQDCENPDGDGSDDLLEFLRTLEEFSPLRGERDVGVAPTGEGA